MQQIHLKIHGLVQGVNFRYYTAEKARNLNLTGLVKNTPDGAVEIIAEGKKSDLEALVAWAKSGPDWARVTNFEINWQRAEGKFKGFEITG